MDQRDASINAQVAAKVAGTLYASVAHGYDFEPAKFDLILKHVSERTLALAAATTTAPQPAQAAQQRPATPGRPRRPAASAAGPACPECSGPMWDNRDRGKGPNYKCKSGGWDKVRQEATGCPGVIWNAEDAATGHAPDDEAPPAEFASYDDEPF